MTLAYPKPVFQIAFTAGPTHPPKASDWMNADEKTFDIHRQPEVTQYKLTAWVRWVRPATTTNTTDPNGSQAKEETDGT